MNIKSLGAVIALTYSLNAAPIALNELIDIALENNTNISLSKLKEENKKYGIDVAVGDYLPSLTATGEFARYDLDNITNDDSGNVDKYTITASQLIYDFGKTIGNISASKEDFEASINETIANTSKTVLDVKTEYYNILKQKRLIDVAQESVKIDDLQLLQASEFFRAGVRTKIDVTNAQLRLSNSELELVKSKYSLKNAKTNFITLLGQERLREDFDVKKEEFGIELLAKNISQSMIDLEKLIKDGLKNRPEINVQKSLINFQRERFNSINGDYYPSIYLKGTYSDTNSDDKISEIEAEDYTAGVYLEWNFFSGMKTISNERQQLANLQSAKENLKLERLKIIEQITASFNNVKESLESIKISILSVKLASQNLELAQERYINGLNDIVELNDAKLEFIRAKSNLVNTYYEYQTNVAQLEYSTGIIYQK